MYKIDLKKIYKCIIIGSGPAGYSASIYAARSDLNPIILSGKLPGGQLTTTNRVDNYLGFPNGIDGVELMDNCKKQITRFDVKILNESVTSVLFSEKKGGIHKIFFGKKNKNVLKSQGVIIATGSTPNFLGIKNEKKLLGSGVSLCATCDGFFYKNKNVAIVGGGDTALEEANYLAKICNNVYILVRKNYFKGSKILQHRIYKKKNINVLFQSTIVEIMGKNFLEGIKFFNNQDKKYETKMINGLFIAIGFYPNTKIFKNQIDLTEKGFIVVEKGKTLTSNPGIFAAGDVQDPDYRQAITSAGSGCMAALDLEKYLYSL
ncbi:thioredoxin-disulfide reductase [Blattabacterium cuenoti]|uniref:thioredoxin-disulfide reductase n=1 Tax=Blattabacterium cuenoti TaxID=1653831 RepID=UPI00163C2FAF|nr:thioredoxin-disulfide reductase [Blattabacterium cuenoti]